MRQHHGIQWKHFPADHVVRQLLQTQLEFILPSVHGYCLVSVGELADDSLQRSLDAEAQQMREGQNKQQVQTYQAGIYDLVRKNWSRPPSARNGMQARFVVELIPTGEVLSVALVNSSGNGSFDRSAEQAIRRARRFDVPEDNQLFEANFRRFYFLFRPEDLLR